MLDARRHALSLVLFLALSPLLAVRPACADTWAVYWYVCGSDLERRMGGASADILEALEAELNENVKVVLQTGGTRKWQNDIVRSDRLERFLIDKDDMTRLGTLPQASMGDSGTLAAFLRFCRENHPADHAVLIIWDHGGGSAYDLANDENFDGDGLSLKEVRAALESAWTPDADNPPLEIIGFDACLMATLDVAHTVHGFARYLVASEDTEPGNGWEYTGFLNALARNVAMGGEELGRHICDTYLAGCRKEETEGSATLSVTDLSQLERLTAAWNALGLEAAKAVMDDSGFYAVMGRHAGAAENYSNSKSSGYSNMVDMGAYVRRLRESLPENSQKLLAALEGAVKYRVNGPFRKSSGLSFYYPLDGGRRYRAMMDNGAMTAFLVLQGLQLGKMDRHAAQERLTAIAERMEAGGWDTVAHGGTAAPASPQPGADTPPASSVGEILANGVTTVLAALNPLETLDISELEDAPLSVSPEGDATLTLGPDKVKYLDAVYFYLAYYSEEDDIIVILGKDGDLHADWEKGEFRDNFRNTWAALDGHLVNLEITAITDETYRYAVPVKLNGERVSLDVIYDFNEQAYRILGARHLLSSGIPDKFLRRLKPGDEITTIFPAMTISSEDDDTEDVDLDTFKLTSSSAIADEELGDGTFMYMFEMNDVQGNSALSALASIEVKDGEIAISAVDQD